MWRGCETIHRHAGDGAHKESARIGVVDVGAGRGGVVILEDDPKDVLHGLDVGKSLFAAVPFAFLLFDQEFEEGLCIETATR